MVVSYLAGFDVVELRVAEAQQLHALWRNVLVAAISTTVTVTSLTVSRNIHRA